MAEFRRKQTVAVVEDEQALQRVLVEWLRSEGYAAIAITDGEEAIQKITRELPDLILLDIILPKVDGFTVMQKLKENPATADIPIIVMTNLGDDEERRRALDLGAKNYLVKAEYDFEAVKSIIGKALSGSS